MVSLCTASSLSPALFIGFYFFVIPDNIPEAIYRELPPKLQQEVQLDTRRVSN